MSETTSARTPRVSRHRHSGRILGSLVVLTAALAGTLVAESPASAAATDKGATIVKFAKEIKAGKAIGPWRGKPVPYVWGGGHGSKPGPSRGTCKGYTGSIRPCPAEKTIGLDCAGLSRWVYSLAYGSDVLSSGNTDSQLRRLKPVRSPRPGDLVFFGTKTRTTHVGIFIGNNLMIEEPGTGSHVRESKVSGHGKLVGYYRR